MVLLVSLVVVPEHFSYARSLTDESSRVKLWHLLTLSQGSCYQGIAQGMSQEQDVQKQFQSSSLHLEISTSMNHRHAHLLSSKTIFRTNHKQIYKKNDKIMEPSVTISDSSKETLSLKSYIENNLDADCQRKSVTRKP